MFAGSASTFCTGYSHRHRDLWQFWSVSIAVMRKWAANRVFIPRYPRHGGYFRPPSGVFAGTSAWCSFGIPKIRALGGHTRTMSARQAIAAAAPAIRTPKVKTQAAASATECPGWRCAAARRSIAVNAGNAAAGSGVCAGGASAGADVCSISCTAAHCSSQRAHRTVRRCFSRSAGTSYAAAHLGQTIRIVTHHGLTQAVIGPAVTVSRRRSLLIPTHRQEADHNDRRRRDRHCPGPAAGWLHAR